MADSSIMQSFAYLVISGIGVAAVAVIALVVLLWYDDRRARKGQDR